eukprot:583635-Pleurochrysis_carterae.AAC.1
MAVLIAGYVVPVQAPRQRPTSEYVARSSGRSDAEFRSNAASAAFGETEATATACAARAALRG